MKKLMGYLPYILGIIIIALIVLLIIVSSGKDDEVNTNDKTNTVSDKELTIDNGADNQTPETQANDGKENNGKKKKEDKTKDTEPTDSPEVTDVPEENPTPTPIPSNTGEGNEFGLKFDEKQDFVTIKAGSRIRAGASTETGIIKELTAETKLERTGYNDSWTRVIYDGMECYVSTSLVIGATNDASATPVPTKAPDDAKPTDAPKNNGSYESKNDYVEIKAGSRIRSEASTDCAIVTTLEDDLIVERTGYNKDWTRINYNGKECYVSTPLVKRTCDKYGTTVDESGNPVKNDNGGSTEENKPDNGGNTGDGENGNDNNGDGNTGDNNDKPAEPPITEFKEKNDYVEVKAGVRVRSSATTDSDDNIVATTSAVSRMKRTGSGSGWARVEYEGKTCYISNTVINCSMTEEQAKAADEAERKAAEEKAAEENNGAED